MPQTHTDGHTALHTHALEEMETLTSACFPEITINEPQVQEHIWTDGELSLTRLIHLKLNTTVNGKMTPYNVDVVFNQSINPILSH